VDAPKPEGACELFARKLTARRSVEAFDVLPPRLHMHIYITPCVESASFPYNYFDVITISTLPWTNNWLGDWNERKRRDGGGRYQDRYMRRHRWWMAVWKAVGVRRKSERRVRRTRTSVGERDGRDVTFATKVSILNATPQVSNRTPRDF
jgi:hypothetical protein